MPSFAVPGTALSCAHGSTSSIRRQQNLAGCRLNRWRHAVPTKACGSLTSNWLPQPLNYHMKQRCFTTLTVPQAPGRPQHQPQDPQGGHHDSCQVTLVTQVSLDRWPRFAQQAAAWQGPVSVAVYIPAPQGTSTADAAMHVLQHLFSSYAEQQPAQDLSVSALFALHYASEGASALPAGCPTPTDASTLSYDQLYPINALRNLALRSAATSHVLLVDADFIPSLELRRQLQQQFDRFDRQPRSAAAVQDTLGSAGDTAGPSLAAAAAVPSQQLFVVVPAFQLQLPPGQQVADTQQLSVPRDKQQLLKAIAAGQVQPFHCGAFPQPTPSLDYQQWQVTSQVLPLQYQPFWEPFGAGPKALLPAFDERFRGYGLNKQQHTLHLAALGFDFRALAEGFLITAPHKRAGSWRAVVGSRTDQEHLQRIQQLYAIFEGELCLGGQL